VSKFQFWTFPIGARLGILEVRCGLAGGLISLCVCAVCVCLCAGVCEVLSTSSCSRTANSLICL